MSNFLLELGTEELPVDALDVVYSTLKEKVAGALDTFRLSYTNVRVEATPRRVAIYIEALAARQKDHVSEMFGPSADKAYDASGNPTPALQGFLKSKGAELKDLKVKETPRGKFVAIEKKETGKAAAAVLPEFLKTILASLSFPKNMRWEKTGVRFPRPIRWIVALLDKKVISFSIGNVKSGNTTYGHRFLAPKAIKVASADWATYAKLLRKAHVILELEERKKLITRGLEKDFDEELLHITANLVEEPYLLEGNFSKDYLQLPPEVLASCMKKNQKIFACYDTKGKLTNRFIAVLNGKRNGLPLIKRGYENVLESRLKDAKYFYVADTKEPLQKKRPLLKQIVYLGKLGTMLDKTERMEKLADKICDLIARPELKNDLRRAAQLSKVDLMTHLVYEFPDLQGIVGCEYARASEKKEIAEAIGTQYLPKNLAEDYKQIAQDFTPLGALLGIVDRLDLLVGAFGTGIEPSGSQDPYGLRRAAGTIVKLIRAFELNFSIDELIQSSVSIYGDKLTNKELSSKLMKFFEERIRFEFQVKGGTREYEILDAILNINNREMADVFNKYETLLQLYKRNPENFIRAAKVVERTSNILKKAPAGTELKPELLKEASEKKLYSLLEERAPAIEQSIAQKNYEKATALFGEIFYQPVNDFFKEVMVNAEDPALRGARQALVRRVNRLYTEKVADLSLLSRLDAG